RPYWHVWARPLGDVQAHDLPFRDQRLQVPADAAGVYLVQIAPDVRPGRSGSGADFQVHAWVEIRRPDSNGSANVWTPENRIFYGRGEAVPFFVLVRVDGTKPI